MWGQAGEQWVSIRDTKITPLSRMARSAEGLENQIKDWSSCCACNIRKKCLTISGHYLFICKMVTRRSASPGMHHFDTVWGRIRLSHTMLMGVQTVGNIVTYPLFFQLNSLTLHSQYAQHYTSHFTSISLINFSVGCLQNVGNDSPECILEHG